VSKEGEEDVAIVSSPSMNPFSSEGDGEVTVYCDCGGWTSKKDCVVALRCRVD
jgi:hypothetical protein